MDEVFQHSVNLDKRTFYRDNLLPSRPLPSIHQTVEKYLDSCKAVLSEDEYEKTKEVCENFKQDEALAIQMQLVQKAVKKRNWLEDWWMDNAYLKLRQPIMYYYFAGPGPYLHTRWPFEENSQLLRSSIVLHNVMQVWMALKSEVFPQHKSGEKGYMSMNQFRYLFNSDRIPKLGKDEIYNSFKTSSEGKSPSHIVVFFRNKIYKVQGVNSETGKILTPPEFYKVLSEIKHNAPLQYGESISALTCLERNTWAKARQYMIELSDLNKKNLQEISDALICFCLDESRPQSYQELYQHGLTGPCSNRWNDKSFNYTCTANGGFIATCDHSPCEAMVQVVFTQFSDRLMKLTVKEFPWPWKTDVKVDFAEELVFKLDDKLHDYIREGLTEYNKFAGNLDVQMTKFDKFGKESLKKLKIHPDGFVQTCLQLTYMRIHGKPAPTYETATTRGFYNGRTETCRTCTPELVAFCTAMISGSSDLCTLFRKAHDKYVWLMNECKEARGCDRHLLGIALQALESGEPMPALFSDPGFTKSGGGGNFVISSSFTGYFDSTGGVAPMVEDGYGCFYCINTDRMFLTTSTWKSSKISNGKLFMEELHKSLLDVYKILINEKLSKL
ncbi:peroxisomal carnitine O-octanoyltransferase-like [Styela clava]